MRSRRESLWEPAREATHRRDPGRSIRMGTPNEGDGTISVINISSATVVATITLPPFNGQPQPTNIVITPDGSTAYVIDFDLGPRARWCMCSMFPAEP